jgi:hypothetical protein
MHRTELKYIGATRITVMTEMTKNVEETRQLFFIRHKTTGLYFPDIKARRGGSFSEATVNGTNARLFNSKRSAQNFLSAWTQGKRESRYDCYGNYIGIDKTPVPSRKLEDYEIIMRDITL